MARMLLSVTLLTSLLFWGCASPEQVCAPGKTDICLCVGGVDGVQSCSADGTSWGACDCGLDPVDTSQPTPDTVGGDSSCVPNDKMHSKGCYENAVFWYDNCGGKGDLIETCKVPEQTCTDGVCVVGCAPMHHKGCENNSVWWFDSCNNKGELIETCPQGAQCADKGSEVICEEGANCTPHAYQKCNGDDVYWFDSCDNVESLAAACGEQEFCLNEKCVKPSYVGNWHVSANPNYKEGFGTYQEAICTLKVDEATVCSDDGGDCQTDEDCTDGQTCATQLSATLTDPIGAVYTGTIEGKLMKLTGSYQSGGVQVDATINVYFEISDEIGGKLPPDRFTGTQLEIVDIGLGPMQAAWSITGKKQ